MSSSRLKSALGVSLVDGCPVNPSHTGRTGIRTNHWHVLDEDDHAVRECFVVFCCPVCFHQVARPFTCTPQRAAAAGVTWDVPGSALEGIDPMLLAALRPLAEHFGFYRLRDAVERLRFYTFVDCPDCSDRVAEKGYGYCRRCDSSGRVEDLPDWDAVFREIGAQA